MAACGKGEESGGKQKERGKIGLYIHEEVFTSFSR